MIIQHAFGYSIVKLVPALASLAALMLFTRLMSPEEFGIYSITLSTATTATTVLGGFLVIGLGRFEPAVRSELERARLHSTVMVVAILICLLVSFVLLVLKFLGQLPELSIEYNYLLLLFVLSLFLTLCQKLLNANLKPQRYGLSLALKNLVFLIAGASCLFMGYGVSGLLASLVVSTFIAAFPALSLWAKVTWNTFDLNLLKQIWIYGAPLTLLYLFVMIIDYSDRIFLDIYIGGEAVGLYSAGYDLTQSTIGPIASIVHLSAFPLILKAFETEGEESARRLLYITIRLLLFILTPVTFGLISVANEFSTVFLGSSFAGASRLLIPVLAFSFFLSTVKSYYIDYSFQIARSTWLQAVSPMFAAVLNCILNYFFIPAYGILGAAYATLISFVFYLALSLALSCKVFKLPAFPWYFAFKLFLSSLCMSFIIKWFQFDILPSLNLLLKVAIGVFVFSIFAFLILKNDLISLFYDGRELRGSAYDN